MLERDVAVKVIRRSAFPPNQVERILKRFEREAKSLARLSHSNIVKVLDYGEHEGAPYLVMEYMPGGTLKQMITARGGKPMTCQEAARLLSQIALGLEYAHQHNLVHRDVKPANMLVSASGRLMLTDFGIAKLLEDREETELTGSSAHVGTPAYMAPEQISGTSMDQRVDIYALSVVFHEMVTGRKPFEADTPMALLLKHASEPLPDPRMYVPDLPDLVVETLQKGLAKQPGDRYENMRQLIEVLDRIAGSGGVPAGVPSGAESSGSGIKPRVLISIAGIGLLGILAVVLAGIYLEYKQASLPVPAVDASSTPVQSPLSSATSSPVILSSPTVFFTETPTLTATAVLTSTPAGPKPGEAGINSKDGAPLVYVPPGPFLMGLSDSQIESLTRINPACTADQFEASGPQREEQTAGYWIYQTEVTNILYRRCVNYGFCPPLHTIVEAGDDERPVAFADWQAAQSYCNWAGARLPTEQEWEKAARGSDGRLFPWGDEPPSLELANLVRYIGKSMRVGSYLSGASPYGALDMAGNVREWLQDSITTGITRGGSFGMEACFGSSGYRNAWKQSQGDYKTGFRCVLDQIP